MSLREVKKLIRVILETSTGAEHQPPLNVQKLVPMLCAAARHACAHCLGRRGERLDADLYWDNVLQVATWLAHNFRVGVLGLDPSATPDAMRTVLRAHALPIAQLLLGEDRAMSRRLRCSVLACATRKPDGSLRIQRRRVPVRHLPLHAHVVAVTADRALPAERTGEALHLLREILATCTATERGAIAWKLEALAQTDRAGHSPGLPARVRVALHRAARRLRADAVLCERVAALLAD